MNVHVKVHVNIRMSENWCEQVYGFMFVQDTSGNWVALRD